MMVKDYYEEVNWSFKPLVGGLNKVVEALNYDKNKVSKVLYRPDLTKEEALQRVSPEVLAEVEAKGDRMVATEDSNVLKFNNVQFDGLNKLMGKVLGNRVTQFGLSGRTWYPENGYMGWHTNSNNKGFRLYCSFAREPGKSFFRFRHPITKEIVTSWDKDGWNFRIFRIGDELLWHSVYSETDRFSIGYALYV
jgi:hypothetical protein